MNESQTSAGNFCQKSSIGTSGMPLELCALIISHFLAFSWTCLSYFLDYVDKDILKSCKYYMCKYIGVSVLHKVKKAPTKFQSALFILHCQLFLL